MKETERLKYFKIAKNLNEKYHNELIQRKLHFRGNRNSFSLISVSSDYPEIGIGGLKSVEEGETELRNINLQKQKKLSTPEKDLQAWIIDYALNNNLNLPFGDFTFITSELASPSPIRPKGIVNDILALDKNNSLIIIELKYKRTNEVKQQTIDFENEVVKTDSAFLFELIEYMLNRKWNNAVRKVAVWPKTEGIPRINEFPEVEEINYKREENTKGFKFFY